MPPRRPTIRLVARQTAAAFAVLLAVPLTSVASAQPSQTDAMKADPMKSDYMKSDSMKAGAMNAGAMDDPADKAFMKAMADMMADTERTPPTGRTDEDFVRMMMPHHQAAVAMAETELTYGRDPDLKAMANAIIASQGEELASMKAWLAKNAEASK